jgi:hypothetical protein
MVLIQRDGRLGGYGLRHHFIRTHLRVGIGFLVLTKKVGVSSWAVCLEDLCVHT